MVVLSVSKYLNRVKKIPIVASVEPRVLLFTRFVCDFCVVWVIQNELFISPCDLILMLLL